MTQRPGHDSPPPDDSRSDDRCKACHYYMSCVKATVKRRKPCPYYVPWTVCTNTYAPTTS